VPEPERDMRFRRQEKIEGRGISPRRLAAAKRALQRQADALPLFSAQIKAEQPTPEERIINHDNNFADWKQGCRDAAAKTWREARAKLRALPREEQEMILKYWNKSGMPAAAHYFATVMHQYIEQGWRPEQ